MAQVIDASVAIAWCAQSQATPLTEAALEAVVAGGGHVPAVFWFEVLHGLSGLAHRNIIGHRHVDEFVEQIARFSLQIDRSYTAPEMTLLHGVARRFALNVYDAAYLDLALRTRLPLATRDEKLARAAEQAGATLFTP